MSSALLQMMSFPSPTFLKLANCQYFLCSWLCFFLALLHQETIIHLDFAILFTTVDNLFPLNNEATCLRPGYELPLQLPVNLSKRATAPNYAEVHGIKLIFNVLQVNTTSFANFTAGLAPLKNLHTIIVTGALFKGPLLPESPVSPGEATICDLVSRSVDHLELVGVAGLNGSIPECLFNSASRLKFFYIGESRRRFFYRAL